MTTSGLVPQRSLTLIFICVNLFLLGFYSTKQLADRVRISFSASHDLGVQQKEHAESCC